MLPELPSTLRQAQDGQAQEQPKGRHARSHLLLTLNLVKVGGAMGRRRFRMIKNCSFLSEGINGGRFCCLRWLSTMWFRVSWLASHIWSRFERLAIGKAPVVDGKVHWFGVPGLANGLAVMRDEETKSLWDHITGECFEGPLAGEILDFWPVSMTTVAAERAKHPERILLKSNHSSLRSLAAKTIFGSRSMINNEGTILAPWFRSSMHSEIDPRLPEGEQGLGLMDGVNRGKFYPMRAIPKGGAIEDQWLGRIVRIERGGIDGVPFARWLDDNQDNENNQNNQPPMQLLTRWYGFSFTYPNCEIYDKKRQPSKSGGRFA